MVSSKVPPGLVFGAVLFNILIYDLEVGGNGFLVTFASGTKLGGVANTDEDGAIVQKHIARLKT